MSPRRLLTSVLVCTVLGFVPAGAVTITQIDTFQDGTTNGWIINLLGMGNPPANTIPSNVATGGPAGAGDRYLLLRSSGIEGAPGGRLVGINASQWTGDYLAAGITGLVMDVNNFGPTDLVLRLLIAGPANPMGPPFNIVVSTNGVPVPNGSGWTRISFPIGLSAFDALSGTVAGALTNAIELRIFHNPFASDPAAAVVASLGVDNISAVPEPESLLLIAAGCFVLGLLRRRLGSKNADRADPQ